MTGTRAAGVIGGQRDAYVEAAVIGAALATARDGRHAPGQDSDTSGPGVRGGASLAAEAAWLAWVAVGGCMAGAWRVPGAGRPQGYGEARRWMLWSARSSPGWS
jgi:hypothetical protein